jgi:hypothetical protein
VSRSVALTLLLWLVCLEMMDASGAHAVESRTPPELVKVAASTEAMLNGVAVSADGRIFCSFPRWTGTATPGVGEVTPAGDLRPFPGGQWNAWAPGQPAADRFVSVHSVHADRFGNLWVVDEGSPPMGEQSGPYIEGGPKLVKINLRKNAVERIYRLSKDVVPEGSDLGHVRATQHTAFVTDPQLAAIIVIDLDSGRARRVLGNQAIARSKPGFVPVIEGREFRIHGKVPEGNLDHVEISLDGQWVYFAALYGPTLYKVPTEYLTDAKYTDEEIVRHSVPVANVPPVSGIALDKHGDLYFSAGMQNAIMKVTAGGALETVMQDPRLDTPNEPSFGPDGYLYVPASQATRLAPFNDGVARWRPPFVVYKIKVE